MRLRLRIERNALPPTQALWPVKDSKSTIAQLLQHVNEVFPLEADTWGLEDYSVSVSEYECLHYHKLREVCKDEDEVVIKALQYADVRARTLVGRDQIAADGRHLLDGVPFGRPCLKGPVRPEISIPPRKKRKLIEDHGEQQGQLMLTENGEEADVDDDEEEDDEDFEAEESVDEGSESEEESAESEDSDESSDDSSDDDSDDTESETTSDSESEDAESWDGIPASEPPTPAQEKNKSTLTNGTAPSSSSTDATPHRKRKRSSDDDVTEREAAHETLTKAAKVKPLQADTLPNEGKPETKVRNLRRREVKKLKHLKRMQILPQDATVKMLHEWVSNNPDVKPYNVETPVKEGDLSNETSVVSAVVDTTTGAEQSMQVASDPAPTADEPEFEPKTKVSNKSEKAGSKEFERQREKLLASIAAGEESPPLRPNVSDTPVTGAHMAVDPLADESNDLSPRTEPRRSKLDLATSQRLVFGSLGVRVPKTQDEKDELQKKLAQRPKRNVNAESGHAIGTALAESHEQIVPDVDEDEDPESWREKIDLTAVECCEEGITLSTPPFPFQQRWDPQQRKKKKHATKRDNNRYMDVAAGKKRKRGSYSEDEHVETYDKYLPNGDILDYGDEYNEDYWEEGALLNGEEDEIDGMEQGEEDDGFPPLPADLEELSILNEADAKEGDFIAFVELACDEKTGWQPKMMTRCARLNQKLPEGEGWMLSLSGRDKLAKTFDADGKRIYSKFEMPDADDNDDDEGLREITWEEMGVVRRVLPPEESATDS